MTSRPPELFPATPPPNQGDTGEIRCICGRTEDDGFTIQCDSCYVWQHAVCVDVESTAIPKHYYCERCQPRTKSRVKPPPLGPAGAGTVTGPVPGFARIASPRDSGESEPALGRTRKNPGDTDERSLQERRKRVKHRPDSSSDSSTQAPLALPKSCDYEAHLAFQPISSNHIPNESPQQPGPVYQYFQLIATHRTHKSEIRKRSQSMASRDADARSSSPLPPSPLEPALLANLSHLTAMDHETLNHPLFKVTQQTLTTTTATTPKTRVGLFAESSVASHRFIIEYKGQIGLKSVYIKDPTNDYAQLRTYRPFVEGHPHFDLYVDARAAGNKARFIRRSCQPNAELRSVTLPGNGDHSVVHLAVFATTDIPQGDEITIGWVWEVSPPTPETDPASSNPSSPLPSKISLIPGSVTKKQVRLLYRTFGEMPCACGQLKSCRLNTLIDRYVAQANPEKQLLISPDSGKRKVGRPPKSATTPSDLSSAGSNTGRPHARTVSSVDSVPRLPSVSPRKKKGPTSRPSSNPDWSESETSRTNGSASSLFSDPHGHMTIDHNQMSQQLNRVDPNEVSDGLGPLSREERKLRDTMALFERMEHKKSRDRARFSSPPLPSDLEPASGPPGDSSGASTPLGLTSDSDHRRPLPGKDRLVNRRIVSAGATATTNPMGPKRNGQDTDAPIGPVLSNVGGSSESASDSEPEIPDSDYEARRNRASRSISKGSKPHDPSRRESIPNRTRAPSRSYPSSSDPDLMGKKSRKRPRSSKGESGTPDANESENVDIENDANSPVFPSTPAASSDPAEGSRRKQIKVDPLPQLRCGLKKYYIDCYLAQQALTKTSRSPKRVITPIPVPLSPKVKSEPVQNIAPTSPSPTTPVNDAETSTQQLAVTADVPEPLFFNKSPASSDTESTIDIDSGDMVEVHQPEPIAKSLPQSPPNPPHLTNGNPVEVPSEDTHIDIDTMSPLQPKLVKMENEASATSLPIPADDSAQFPIPLSSVPMELSTSAGSNPVAAIDGSLPRKTKLSLSEYQKRNKVPKSEPDSDPSLASMVIGVSTVARTELVPEISVSPPPPAPVADQPAGPVVPEDQVEFPGMVAASSEAPVDKGVPIPPSSPPPTTSAKELDVAEEPPTMAPALVSTEIPPPDVATETPSPVAPSAPVTKTRVSLKEYTSLKRKTKSATHVITRTPSNQLIDPPPVPVTVSPPNDDLPSKPKEVEPPVEPLETPQEALGLKALVSPPTLTASILTSPDEAKDELQSILSRELTGIVAPDVISRLSTPTSTPCTATKPMTPHSEDIVPLVAPVASAVEAKSSQAPQPEDPFQLPELPNVTVYRKPDGQLNASETLVSPRSSPVADLPPVSATAPFVKRDLRSNDLHESSEEGEVVSDGQMADEPTGFGYDQPPSRPVTPGAGLPYPPPPVSRRVSHHDYSASSYRYRGQSGHSPREHGSPENGERSSTRTPGSRNLSPEQGVPAYSQHHHHHRSHPYAAEPGTLYPSNKPSGGTGHNRHSGSSHSTAPNCGSSYGRNNYSSTRPNFRNSNYTGGNVNGNYNGLPNGGGPHRTQSYSGGYSNDRRGGTTPPPSSRSYNHPRHGYSGNNSGINTSAAPVPSGGASGSSSSSKSTYHHSSSGVRGGGPTGGSGGSSFGSSNSRGLSHSGPRNRSPYYPKHTPPPPPPPM
ncbi:SET domain-containing protein 3 [Dimargaris cristalligena]|nr:SET domain-containing protein 3 [Dimargaris cristalligena]